MKEALDPQKHEEKKLINQFHAQREILDLISSRVSFLYWLTIISLIVGLGLFFRAQSELSTFKKEYKKKQNKKFYPVRNY